MSTIKIQGVIVYKTDSKEYDFVEYLRPRHFSDGAYLTCVRGLVLICPHTIEIDAPDVDLITPQLRELDRQEEDAAAKYQAIKTQIDAQRQSLLAIECSPDVA